MDHTNQIIVERLKNAGALISGILMMIEQGYETVELSLEIAAAQRLMREVYSLVLMGHLENCLAEVIEKGADRQEYNDIICILESLVG